MGNALISLGCAAQEANALSVPDFIEKIILDENGAPLILADIHRSWHRHVDNCRAAGQWAGILAPWGHGKSEEMVIARTLCEIAHNPNLRIKILSSNDNIARKRVMAIKQRIQNPDSAFRELYPDIQPADDMPWNSTELYLKRCSESKDPTLDGRGVLASDMGSRADMLIFDDPVDLRNAIQQPVLRAKVKEAVRSGWLSRLEPTGFVIYIATVWHEDDLSMELLSNTRFNFLVQSIAEDFSCIECRYTNGGRRVE